MDIILAVRDSVMVNTKIGLLMYSRWVTIIYSNASTRLVAFVTKSEWLELLKTSTQSCIHRYSFFTHRENNHSVMFNPANTRRALNVGVMLVHRLRRWLSITPTLSLIQVLTKFSGVLRGRVDRVCHMTAVIPLSFKSRQQASKAHRGFQSSAGLLYKAKRQYLLTCWVSR